MITVKLEITDEGKFNAYFEGGTLIMHLGMVEAAEAILRGRVIQNDIHIQKKKDNAEKAPVANGYIDPR